MNTYKLYTYDLWGNDKDGYTINDYYAQEIYEISEDLTDDQIFKMIGIKHQSRRHVEIDDAISDHDYALYIIRKKDNKPICELRRVEI
jgi:hypothetical protein